MPVRVKPVLNVSAVSAPIAVLKVAASKKETVLSALVLKKLIADGLIAVNKLVPIVVAPKEVRPIAGISPVVPPSHFNLSVNALFQLALLSVNEVPQAVPVDTAIPAAG